MARSFKPQCNFYHKNDGKLVEKRYKNIVELRKKLKENLEDSQGQVTVYRHRRGEWGEWREVWEFNDKRKPVIVEDGWM